MDGQRRCRAFVRRLSASAFHSARPPPEDALVEIRFTSDAGGIWQLQRRDNSWRFIEENVVEESSDVSLEADVVVSLPPDTARKLFARGITPNEARKRARIHGNARLAEPLFAMVSVMAKPRETASSLS